MAIGGLESKIFGAKAAGAVKVLCPYDNQDCLNRIMKEHPNIFGKHFQVKTVKNIEQVLNIMLC